MRFDVIDALMVGLLFLCIIAFIKAVAAALPQVMA